MAKERIIPIFVPHLGCPRACVFCNQSRITGADTNVTAETVKREIEAALLKLGGEKAQTAFYGGSFTAIAGEKQESLLAAAYEFVQAGKISGIRLSTRPDAVDEQVIARLLRYGVQTVELGCQSMDDNVLRLSRRGHDAACCERAAKLIKQAGIRLILQMMTGLPGDRGPESLATAQRLIALKPDGVRIYPTVVVKDTELYDLWLAGAYEAHRVEDAVALCAKLLVLFENAGIPVIRLGLNPTEDLSNGAAVAGAYHPALGELVRSRVYLEKMRNQLAGRNLPKRVSFTVPRGAVSLAVGQKKANIEALKKEFTLERIAIMESEKPEGDIFLQFEP